MNRRRNLWIVFWGAAVCHLCCALVLIDVRFILVSLTGFCVATVGFVRYCAGWRQW